MSPSSSHISQCDEYVNSMSKKFRSNYGSIDHLAMNLRKEAPTFCALGGSLTAGADVGGKNHTWFRFLNELFVDVDLYTQSRFINLARRATGSNFAVARFFSIMPKDPCDIIFLEYALNDDDHSIETKARYKDHDDIMVYFETLLVSLFYHYPTSAVVVLEVFRQLESVMYGFSSGQNSHDVVSKYYDVPVFSMRDLIWHSFYQDVTSGRQSSLTKAFPPGRHHPSLEGQKMIAKNVFCELLGERNNEAAHSESTGNVSLPTLFGGHVIRQYSFDLSFEIDQGQNKGIKYLNWEYVLEGGNKPGFMTTSLPNWLWIHVMDACHQYARVGYFRSYENVDDARVLLIYQKKKPGGQTTMYVDERRLRGLWDASRGSQTDFISINLRSEMTLTGVNITMVPAVEHSGLPAHKFKLTSFSCA